MRIHVRRDPRRSILTIHYLLKIFAVRFPIFGTETNSHDRGDQTQCLSKKHDAVINKDWACFRQTQEVEWFIAHFLKKRKKKKVCKNLDQMNFCFLITKRTKSCKKCQLWSILQAGEMALLWALRGMEQTPPGIWCHSMAVIQTGSCLSAMVGKMLKVQKVSLISFNVWIRLYGGFFLPGIRNAKECDFLVQINALQKVWCDPTTTRCPAGSPETQSFLVL